MKRIIFTIFGGVALLMLVMLAPVSAFAHVNVHFDVGVPLWVDPPPVYYEPSPRYYSPPPPVYYGPEVVYHDRGWGDRDQRGHHDEGRHRGQRHHHDD